MATKKPKEMTSAERAELIVSTVNKHVGEGTLRFASDPSLIVQTISTGVFPIDVMLGGGLPRNRWTEFYGDFSTLKSFIAYSAIASCQQSGGLAALTDTEHAYDPVWGAIIGVDNDTLILDQPEYGEKAVDVMEVAIRNGVDLLVWDSIASTLPKTEHDKSSDEKVQPARLASMMSLALRKLTAANRNTAIMVINQTRESIGNMFTPETTTGGKSMPYYAGHRIAMRKAGRITEETTVWDGKKNRTVKKVVGLNIKATLEKSKLTKPYAESWFTWDYRTGQIDLTGYLISQGLEHGIVLRSGKAGWRLSWRRTTIQGAEKFRGYLEANPEEVVRLQTEVAVANELPGSVAPVKSRGGRRKKLS